MISVDADETMALRVYFYPSYLSFKDIWENVRLCLCVRSLSLYLSLSARVRGGNGEKNDIISYISFENMSKNIHKISNAFIPWKKKSQIKAQITFNVKTTCRSFHCFHISIYHIQKIDFNGIINWRWNYLEDFSIAMLQCHLLIINIQLLRYMAYCSLRNWRFLIV